MHITENMKMAAIVQMNYLLLNVLNRFGISLGFGDKTIAEVCNEKCIDTELFVEIINAFHREDYVFKTSEKRFSATTIVHYLRETHEEYRSILIPHLEVLINDLINENEKIDQKWLLLRKFFNDYKESVLEHLDQEDKIIFPYVEQVIKVCKMGNMPNNLSKVIIERSIADFEDDHENLEERLFDLKNIILKYMPAPVNNVRAIKFLMELFEFEKDLNDHARLEDNLLFPIVSNMEKQLMATYRE